MPGELKRASEGGNHKICFDKGGLWRAYVSAGGIERTKKKSGCFTPLLNDLSFLSRLMLPCLATTKELAQAINTSQGGVLGMMGKGK
jgi:hypothetical protein